MWSFVAFEIKRLLKTKRVFFAVLFIFLYLSAVAVNYKQQSEYEEVYGWKLLNWAEAMLEGVSGSGDAEKQTVVKEWQQVVKEAKRAQESGDWKTYDERSLENSVYVYRYLKNYRGDMISDIDYYMQHNEEMEGIIERRGLTKIRVPDIIGNSDDWRIRSDASLLFSEYHDVWHTMRVFDGLVDAGIKPINHYQVDSVTIWFHALQMLLPLFFPVLLFLLFFDHLAQEKEQGSIKVLFSLPKMRNWYCIGKTLAQGAAACCILIIPTGILSVMMAIFDHGASFFYPTLFFRDGLSSFACSYNKLYALERAVYYGTLDEDTYYQGLVQYSPFGMTNAGVEGGGGFSYMNVGFSPHMDYDYMPLWKFLLLAFLLAIIFILFIVSLQMLCTIIIKHKILALGSALAIYWAACSAVPPETTEVIQMLNPFAYRNAVFTIGGTTSYPFLAGILVLLFAIIFLQLLCFLLLRKRDLG